MDFLRDNLGAAGAAAGNYFGGPLGGFAGGVLGNALSGLFGDSDEEKAAKAHRRKLAEIAKKIEADRARQFQGRIAMTQNAGAAFLPANQMMRSMSGGRTPGVDMGRVFANPETGKRAQY